jgi:hypothetical protein
MHTAHLMGFNSLIIDCSIQRNVYIYSLQSVLKDKKPPQNLKGYIKHACLSESALFIHKPVHVGLLLFRAIVGQNFSQFCTFGAFVEQMTTVTC